MNRRGFLAGSLGAAVAFVSVSDGKVAVAAGRDPSPLWRPRIAVVWPHDGQGNAVPVAQSRAVNVSIWPTDPTRCASPSMYLYRDLMTLSVAKNDDPAKPVTIQPRWVDRVVDGVTFPTFEFANIPADLVAEPWARYSFVVTDGILVGGPPPRSNVWVHAVDARTDYPVPVVPSGPGFQSLPMVDLRIQIVWPHDEDGDYAPVDQASLVNVAVDLFEHGTLKSVPASFPPEGVNPPDLLIAEENGPLQPSEIVPRKISYRYDTRTYPRWVFNDVPVIPGHQYHFMAVISGGLAYHSEYSSIWTHGAFPQTNLPDPSPPPACVS